MKTILTEKIDNYVIIKGFGDPTIEPVETKRKVEGLMKNQPEVKDCQKKAEELNRLFVAKLQDITSAKQAFSRGDKTEHAKLAYQIELREEQIKVINKELVKLKANLEKKRLKIWKENLIYFEPKPGETMIREDDYLDLGQKMMDAKIERGNLLTLDGQEIIDKRGVKYIKNGKVVEIKEIGIDIDGPLVQDVNPDEFKRMQYSYMSIEDVEAEKQNKVNSLATQAANMRNMLEIQGNDDALTVARDWYNQELSSLDDEYNQILEDRADDVEARN